MDIQVENEIIIIGGNHHNMLGVIRALGEKGIYSNIIVTHVEKYAYVTKSKYVKEFTIISEKEEEVLNSLEKYKVLNKKAVLIPTSDFAAYVIDKNLNMLKKYFYVPSINEQEGLIVKYMDKFNQYNLVKKYNINIAKCIKINLNKKIDYSKISFPKVIIKPIISAMGSKNDIKICQNIEEVKESIIQLKKIGYQNVLIQEYIDFDEECGIIGCIDDKRIIIPGIIKKIRIYPSKRGSNSYSKIVEFNKNDCINNIVKLLKDINYSGLFDVEVFLKGKEIYLNEINFRNSGNTFAFYYDDINLVYIWLKLKLNKTIKNEKKVINSEFRFIDEFLELKQLKSKNINIKEFFNARKNAKARLFNYKKDKRVTFYRILYAVKRRIKK